MELLEDRGDVLYGGCVSDDACGRILDKLEFMESFLRETKQERVAVINSGSDKAMDKNGSGERSESRAKTVDVSEMEIG